jgi:hypothetical protein
MLQKFSDSKKMFPIYQEGIKVDAADYKPGQCLIIMGDPLAQPSGKLWLHNVFLLSNMQYEYKWTQLDLADTYISRTTLVSDGSLPGGCAFIAIPSGFMTAPLKKT